MLERIERLLASLDQRQPLDDDLSNWLSQGFIRHINEGITLNAALNISGARDVYLRKRRNQALLKAWAAHQRIDPSMSNTQRSSELAALLNRFKAGRWERIKFDPVPPETLDEVHIWLFYALKTGVPILKWRQLYNIVQNTEYLFCNENEIGCIHQNKKNF